MEEGKDQKNRRWLIVGVCVPIVVAGIGILPFILGDNEGDQAPVLFSVDVVVKQLNSSGIEVDETLMETLHLASNKINSDNADEAIPLLEKVSEQAAVPAVLNNLVYPAINSVK